MTGSGNGGSTKARRSSLLAMLHWQSAMGADEAIENAPVDHRKPARDPASAQALPQTAAPDPPPRAVAPAALAEPGADAAVAAAGPGELDTAPDAALSQVATLEALREAVERFDGCALKRTATNLVFARGSREAPVMFIGEAPGAEEDRAGLPFVGASGRLLDRMLGFIGLDEQSVYITNILFWRPPGNRNPTDAEIAACLPFVRRHIALLQPKVIVTLGRPAMNTVLGISERITRARGRWYDYVDGQLGGPIPAMPTFHPAYLLRNPAQKREAWVDLLTLRDKLETIS